MSVEINKNITEKVEQLLRKYPHLRDDDNKLIANIWAMDKYMVDMITHDMEIKIKDLTALGFLELVAEGKVVNPESIRRTRQKLQEEYPELRGKSYLNRHKKQGKIKEDIKDITLLEGSGAPEPRGITQPDLFDPRNKI